MPCYYRAFGLRIEADQPIPGLASSDAFTSADLVIDTSGHLPDVLGEQGRELYLSSESGENDLPVLRVSAFSNDRYVRFLYDDGAEFLIDGRGARLWARWPGSLTMDDVGPYITGPILGFVLRLRGVTSLHASAVVVDGRAIAFVGPAWAGKSTTAAAFARLGFSVLTDDIVTVAEAGGDFVVNPGYPRLRLWPESVEKLFGSREALPKISPGDQNWDKRYLDLSGAHFRFASETLPLGAVYILGQRSLDEAAPRIEDLAESVKLVCMVGNTYSNYVLDKRVRAREFALLGRLASSVPVRVVVAHEDAARLDRLCEVILSDYAALRGTSGPRALTQSH